MISGNHIGLFLIFEIASRKMVYKVAEDAEYSSPRAILDIFQGVEYILLFYIYTEPNRFCFSPGICFVFFLSHQ